MILKFEKKREREREKREKREHLPGARELGKTDPVCNAERGMRGAGGREGQLTVLFVCIL
jgi:hypothetical protein